jgi:predicted transglutaminase-like cysteine proteinase
LKTPFIALRFLACAVLCVAFGMRATAQTKPSWLDWSVFGHEALWDGWTARELDPRRWAVLTAPLGSVDRTGAKILQDEAHAVRHMAPLDQLNAVNRFVNQRPYVSDINQFGVQDHWLHAEQFIRQGGDCKDFVIAKYRLLMAAGFAEANLRILLVEDRLSRSDHAILAARVGDYIYILDNQVRDLRHESQVTAYRPIYAFNRREVFYYPSEKPRPALPDLIVSARSR